MRAIIAVKPGGPEVLEIVERPAPEPGPQDLIVRNFAAALNRADLLQRRGLYPPPVGESDVLGLELAGEVLEVGKETRGFRRGDRVFGIVAGGAYADLVKIHYRLAIPIPDNLSFDAAAALPEACFTANESLFTLGRLSAGDWLLVHAGASGVGSAAIQIASARGINILATAGSAEKAAACERFGARRAVNYKQEDFVEAVREAAPELGVDAVLDFVGAQYWEKNLECLRDGGRLLVVGTLGGTKVQVDLGILLRRRLQVIGTALRVRSIEDKIAITERFVEDVLPLIQSGQVKPVLDKVYPFDDVRAAHERMEANLNTGKIVLRL